MNNNISVYIHWPFCLSKCAYCNFNSYPMPSLDADVWAAAYLKELESFSQALCGKTVRTIYFGGGTPSLMPIQITEQILEKISVLANVATDAEITVESNPTSSQQCRLVQFKAAGINRVSLGIQALNDADLKFLGRTHSTATGLAALDRVKNLFDNYSFDLIFARPNQTLKAWQDEMDTVLQYVGPHVSLYQLTIEKATKLYELKRKKKLSGLVSQDLAVQMHHHANAALKNSGIMQYEISNYAKPEFESKHNLAYWNYDEYIGIGPGAHSRIHEEHGRVVSVQAENDPAKWLKLGAFKRHILNQKQVAAEYVLMNLRKTTGILKKDFANKFGRELEDFLNLTQMASLVEIGYLKTNSKIICTTESGKDFVDNLACKILTA